MSVKESLVDVVVDDTVKLARLMLKYPFSLRGIKDKVDEIQRTKLCTGWMLFINRAGTLAHIMHKEDVDSYVRMKIPKSVAGADPEYLRRWIYNRMISRYVI